MTIRPAAVAGMFYPGTRQSLQASIHAMLQAVPDYQGPTPKVLVVPHAGYQYSGIVAAEAYKQLAGSHYRRVVLLGPAHRVPVHGMALPEAEAFQTPLGTIPLDTDTIRQLAAQHPAARYMDVAHELEHSLEVQLPFIQTLLPDAKLVPVVVGETHPEQVQALLESVWDDDTLIIISTDLSHFHPYAEARALDLDTLQRILSFSTHLHGEQACGCRPLNGLLLAAQQRQLQIELIDYKNSGDTAGSRESVVGYAALSLFE